jgi:hypothetical protein
MKFYLSLVLLGTLCLPFSVCCTTSFGQESEKTSVDILDIVYEWDGDGDSIQIGDYNIIKFDSVMEDRGEGKMVPVSRNKIQRESIAKTKLTSKNSDGFWSAGQIIIFSGPALEAAKLQLPSDKQNVLKGFSNQKVDDQPAKKQEQKLTKENDVWKN